MQITLAIDYCDKLVNLETLLDENLEEFKFLGSFTAEKKRMTEQIFSLREEIVSKINELEGKLDDSSTQMDFMSNTLAEMKNDSQDPKGDYYTIQDQILIQIQDLKSIQSNRDDQIKQLTEVKGDNEDLHASEFSEMKEVLKLLTECYQ